MQHQITPEQFIHILYSFYGLSKTEAGNLAEEYGNDIGAYIEEHGMRIETMSELINYLRYHTN